MNILFLTSEGFDTPNANNHLSMTLIEDLLSADIGVYLVSRCKNKSKKAEYTPASLIDRAGFTHDVIERPVIDKSHFVMRYLDGISFAFKAMKKWKGKKHDIDAVLLQSNPNAVYSAFLLKLFLRKPIVYNIYDIFPGHAYEIGVIKSKLIFKAFRHIQKILYLMCFNIVAMSEDMKSALVRLGVNPKKIRVISNWYDTALFINKPDEENLFLRKYELPFDKFYVQFAGAIGYVFDYDMFLKVSELLIPFKDIEFLLIGDGKLKDTVLSEIERRNITNIRYFPWQPLEIIADVYSACNVGIIPLKKGVIGNGVPSKACQLMACGKVVLNVVEPSDYSRMFEDKHIGVSVTDANPETVRDAILGLYQDRDRLKEIGENARAFAHENFSREANTEKFIRLFRELKQ